MAIDHVSCIYPLLVRAQYLKMYEFRDLGFVWGELGYPEELDLSQL